jgi:hypothetical protein
MSSRTYICIPCRTSRRAEAAYGLNTDLRCSQCGGRLWELEWRWRIPRKQDDKGWRELEAKVAGDAIDWLPRRRKLGEDRLADLDRQIETTLTRKPSDTRDRRLRQLQANQTVQRIRASRFAPRQIKRQ